MSWGVDLTEERLCCFIGTAAKVHVLASGIGGTLIREGFDVRCRFCRRKVDVLDASSCDELGSGTSLTSGFGGGSGTSLTSGIGGGFSMKQVS